MRFFNCKEGFERIDALGASGDDFFFLISYDRSQILAQRLSDLPKKLLYRLDSWSNENSLATPLAQIKTNLSIRPISFKRYLLAFKQVQEQIAQGNSYLLNLTFPSRIEASLSLEYLYRAAQAPFKLYLPEHFVCFSPERFITIQNNTISTYPMKGTIEASLPNAANKILSNPKECAEHVMITDLMRNDLNQIASRVRVERFRYLDKIHAGGKELYQVSSKIVGELEKNWRKRIGSILWAITPAGSISGTPKRKTIEIIENVEGYDRGFYTGIFGLCKGEELRSAVLIRFIEKSEEEYIYKSGGGITIDSDPYLEYQELLDKIYLPV